MSGLYYLRAYLRRHARIILLGFGFIVVSNLLGLVLPYIIALAIDNVSNHGLSSETFIFALILMGTALVTGVFQLGARFIISATSRDIEFEIRNDLYKHFVKLELSFFQQRKLGDLVARATNDMSAVRMLLGPGINNLLNTSVAILATFIVMASINLRLMLYVLVILPLMSILFGSLNSRLHKSYRKVQDQFGEVSAKAQENFSGIRVVKAYAQEHEELQSFNITNSEYVKRSIQFLRLDTLLWPAMYMISGIAAAVLLWQGGADVIQGKISLGQLVQFNTYVAQLTWPMISLGWVTNLFQQGSASLARIREVMEYQPEIIDSALTNPEAQITAGAISVQHVSMRYDAGEVLHDISFEVPAGHSLAIVGATGAGKSTLVNLLTRTFEPTEGAIYIDGNEIRTIPLEELHKAVGYVPQESFLFSMTLAENVAYGNPDMSREEIANALDISQLSKDIADFPHGLDTIIGERGVTLSGGQKQRSGIARAVAKNPMILILDDSLSSVDTNTEAEILRRMRVFMKNRTAIIIAHRISAVKEMDNIIVLADGKIAEQGTHNELINHKGFYHSLYRRQLLGEELSLDAGDLNSENFDTKSYSNSATNE